MRKLLTVLAFFAAGSAPAAVGPLINGNQINPQTAISISTLTVTGTTGIVTTAINASASANTIGILNTNSAAIFGGVGTQDIGTTGNYWRSIYGKGWSVLVGTASFSGSATATNFIGPGTGLTGTAASLTAGNVTTNANLTGGVTSVGNAATVVTNANLTGGVTSVGNAATVVTNANLTGVVTSVGNATSFAASPTFTGNVTAGGFVGNSYSAPVSGTSLYCSYNSGDQGYCVSRNFSTGVDQGFTLAASTLIVTGAITAQNQPTIMAIRSSDQIIPNATYTSASELYPGTEAWKVNMTHSNTVSSNTITVPLTGKYQGDCHVLWPAGTSGTREQDIMVNGSRALMNQTISAASITTQTSGVISVNAGDAVTCRLYQDSGGPLTIVGGTGLSYFSLYKVP